MHATHNFLVGVTSSCNNAPKAILYDIAVKTGFIFKEAGFSFRDHDRYELIDVVWFDWKKDLLEISKLYPDVLLDVIFDNFHGYTIHYIKDGKSYDTKVAWNESDPVFDESRLVKG